MEGRLQEKIAKRLFNFCKNIDILLHLKNQLCSTYNVFILDITSCGFQDIIEPKKRRFLRQH